MRLTLNGWQRLWVVASVLLLLLAGAITASTFPSPDNVAHKSVFETNLSPNAKSKLVVPDEKGVVWDEQVGLEVEMPNAHILKFKKGVKSNEAKIVGSEYYDTLKREANRERLFRISIAATWWLLSILCVYALGWAIGWVYKGFRKAP